MGRGASAAEDFLVEFHRRTPSCTPLAFADRAAVGDGFAWSSSYDALAELARPADRSILDVACGDGYLLERLHARAPQAALVGIDMSDGELAAARDRLGERAELRLERAQALSMPDACVDLATCHMAFMLMDDAPAVVAELRRVLRPGGRVGLVIGRGMADTPAEAVYLRLLRAAFASEGVPPLRLGDPVLRRDDGLALLFADGFTDHAQCDFEVGFVGDVAALWREITLSYDLWRLSPSGREALREAVCAEWAALEAPLSLVWRLRRFTATRAR
ncbi:class I SAM-dependent methyltransferase [Caldimonas sp. KR1-144]|uniref:class I SAM-dependent methyltransferase n=1 Tax=Caldimonas sp. KR1-144 TaxID=3400911 RepID=UPI003C0A3772